VLPGIAGDKALISAYINDPAVPVGLIAVLALPVIAAILTLMTAVFTAIAWKDRYWTLPHRIHYTVILAALAAMLWWVNFWNLWVFCL
jgi:uncharacterized membrane-anchored protein